MRCCVRLVAIAACALALVSQPQAQTRLEPAEANNSFTEAAQSIPRVIGNEFTLSGVTVYPAPVLAALKIIFKSDAKLVFNVNAIAEQRSLFIFSEEIIPEDNNHPGTITWERGARLAQPPQGAGTAGEDNGA